MLSEFIQWFAGKMGDRRHYARKHEPFPAWWIVDEKTAKPAMGQEISASGVQLVFKDDPPTGDFNLILQVKERRIKARVTIAWADKAEDNGAILHRVGCKFSGISADDWDFLVRYVNGTPEPDEKLALELEELKNHPDDAYRLIPQAIQIKIVDMLVERNRLAPPSSSQTPLIKMYYGGCQTRADGKKTYRLNVHSRMKAEDEMLAFDTRFTIEDSGEVKITS